MLCISSVRLTKKDTSKTKRQILKNTIALSKFLGKMPICVVVHDESVQRTVYRLHHGETKFAIF